MRGKHSVEQLAEIIGRKKLKKALQSVPTVKLAQMLGISRNTLYKLRLHLDLPIIGRDKNEAT